MKPTHEPLSGESTPLNGRRIRVPTDFSKPAECAVKIAGGMAAQCGAKIFLRHSVQWPASPLIKAAPGGDAIMVAARASLDEMAREIPVGLLQDKFVRLGAQGTIPEIIAAGAENGGGFNRNRNARPWRAGHGLARRPGGKAVRQAPCPVLVARRPEDFSATNSKRDQ